MINNPFDNNAVDTNQFLSIFQNEACARMELALSGNSIGVLTGEIGSGKSTVIRHLTLKLPSNNFEVVYLCVSRMKPRDLYSELLYKIGESPPFVLNQAKRLFNEVIQQRHKQNEKKLCLIIDEAHEIHPDTLLEIRILMNFEMDSGSLFPLILCGQPELRKLLKLKKFEPISQRIKMQYHLLGMTKNELTEYVNVRMSSAQMDRPVFSESALTKIYSYSQGIPRIINALCSATLFDSLSSNDTVIEEKHIAKVIADMDRQKGLIL